MDKYDKLKEFKDLFDKGLINKEEFSKLKNEILFDLKFKKDSTSNQKHNVEIDIKENSSTTIPNETVNNGKKIYTFFIILFCALILGLSIKKDFPKEVKGESNNSTTSPTINSSSQKTTTVCKICGRNFTGDGYDKIDGVWQKNTSLQTELCSQNCGMIEDQRMNQKYNRILVKHGYAPIDYSESSTSNHAQPNNNGFFTGSDGQLHQASPCGNCNHTGFINMGDGIQVCPMCNGKGEIIH